MFLTTREIHMTMVTTQSTPAHSIETYDLPNAVRIAAIGSYFTKTSPLSSF